MQYFVYRTVGLAAIASLVTSSGAQAQTPSAPLLPPISSAAPQAVVLVPQDTPVELMAPTEVSTATATAGTLFKLRVNKAVVIDGRTVIPVGTLAFGKVLAAIDSGGLGRSGQMSAKLMHVQLGDAEIPLEGETSAKGQGAGSAGVAVLFGGVLGLFHRGNNAKIKAGEILSGFVGRDTLIDLSGPKARIAAAIPNDQARP
jgi:hypothetical protein